jgi:hypothetical protein
VKTEIKYGIYLGDKKIAEVDSLDDVTTKETRGFTEIVSNLSQDQIKEIIEKI